MNLIGLNKLCGPLDVLVVVVAEQYNSTGATLRSTWTVQEHVTDGETRPQSRRDFVPVFHTYSPFI